MVNQDFGFQLYMLSQKVALIENVIGKLNHGIKGADSNWDNATLLREWGICKRTAANYRKNGLDYFKRGGLVFYSPESREKFIKNKDLMQKERTE